MKRLFLLASALAFLAACSNDSDKTPQGQYESGLKQAESEDFRKAESTFVQLQRADSATSLGDLGLAQTFERKLWWLDALNHYLRVLEKEPEHAQAIGGTTRCFYSLGAYTDAERYAKKWTALVPNEYQPHYWHTISLLNMNVLGEAEKALKEARDKGLDDGASTLLDARLQWKRNQFEAAVSLGTQGMNSDSKSQEYYDALADYYAERGIADSAIASAHSGFTNELSAVAAWRLLAMSSRFNSFWASRQMLKRWASLDHEGSIANMLFFQYYIDAKDKSQASLMADKFQEISPTAYTTMYYSAMAYRNLYNELLSADFLEQAVDVATTGTSAVFGEFLGAYVGYSYCQSYNRDGAAKRLQEVKGWRTETTEFQSAIFTQMMISGGRNLAEQMFDSLKPTHGDNAVWLTAIGDRYLNTIGVPFSMGLRIYDLALEKLPSYRPAIVGLVKLAVKTGEYQAAIDAFDRYKQYGPSSPELEFLKARALVRVGRVDEGLTHFKQTLSANPQSVEPVHGIMIDLAAKQLYDKIRDLAQYCMETSPQNPDMFELSARFLLDWGFAQEGLGAAQNGLKIEIYNLRLKAQEARGLYATKQTEESKRKFEDIFTKDQAQGEAILYYSHVLAESGGDTLRAEMMAQRALAMVSPDYFPAKNLTRVYLAMNRYTQSREACLRAVEVSPEDPEAWYLMGVCQYNEKLPGAKESLQKAVTLGLTGTALSNAQELLNKL